MKIACLQFAPQLGKVDENIARVDALLEAADMSNLDLLVLPELAFSGYNFPSLIAITPYLEPTASGPTTQWAKRTAQRLNCIVSVGYPERSTTPNPTKEPNPNSNPRPDPHAVESIQPLPDSPPAANTEITAVPKYNSTITIAPSGTILAHYRKTHLYYTDETWASESPSKWLTTPLPLPLPLSSPSNPHSSLPTPPNKTLPSPPSPPPPSPETIPTAFGICMDLQPHRFLAPTTLFEFASHIVASQARLVICSMAWLTPLSGFDVADQPLEPDLGTLACWVGRFAPLMAVAAPKGKNGNGNGDRGGDRDGGDGGKNVSEKIVIIANRCGEEEGFGEGGEVARYAGTSVVLGFGGDGKGKGQEEKVKVWGVMGRGEEGLLRVDTAVEARWIVRLEGGGGGNEDEDGIEDGDGDDSVEDARKRGA